jgi:hypothetical protein
VVPAVFLLIDAALLAAFTVGLLYLIATVCIFTCEPLSDATIRSMVVIGAIGTALVATHVLVAVGLLAGRPAARYGGIVIGLVWAGVSLMVVAEQTSNGPRQFAGVWAVAGIATLLACLAPLPPLRDAR